MGAHRNKTFLFPDFILYRIDARKTPDLASRLLMYERRDVLKAALAAVASGLAPSVARAQGPQPAAPGPAPFNRDLILGFARTLSAKPYAAPSGDLREPFASLTYEQFVGIKTKPGAALWSGENKGFTIEPLHRGNIFTMPVELFIVENGAAARVPYDQNRFDYGGLKVPEKLPDLGYSGFRVLRAQAGGAEAELALFQGASFYRAVAAGQTLGEFPAFRSFWIEKPAPGDNALTIHALLDSPSVTGVYRFTLRPGEATLIDTEMTLFPRTNVDHYGLAGFAAPALFTPLDTRRRGDDLRPMATATNGVQMLTGAGEWLWRPVSNREELQFSSFVDVNPKGFGALLRNRDISDYQDDDQHWEKRPSLWIEPLGDWGEGAIQLVEIPSESENNENIVAYWRPKAPLVGGAQATFAYRQFWCWEPPSRPPMAVAIHSRSGHVPSTRLRRFVVVFSGDVLADAQKTAHLSAALTTSPGSAQNIRTFLNPQAKTCRVVFDVDRAGENYCEMRLVLRSDEQPLSETWLYRWTP